jgi:hypothetical protein
VSDQASNPAEATTSAWSPPASPPESESSVPVPLERIELAAGGAFAGGLVLALILKRLAR